MKSVVFVLLFLNGLVYAQINEGVFDDYIYFVNQNRPTYEDVEGSPYLSDDFIPVQINESSKVVFIKFNVFNNSIEVKKSDKEVVILSLEPDYRFKLLDGYNTCYEIHTYLDDKGIERRTFFEKIQSEPNFTLFLKDNVKFMPKKMATSGFEQNQPAKFVKSNSTFYIGRPKEDSLKLVAVPTRKKEISTFFNEKSKLVLQFIKKERLKLDVEEDLVKLFDFYWSED